MCVVGNDTRVNPHILVVARELGFMLVELRSATIAHLLGRSNVLVFTISENRGAVVGQINCRFVVRQLDLSWIHLDLFLPDLCFRRMASIFC